MELRKILIGIEGLKAKGSLDLDISSIECDYREVKEGSLFVAIKGFEVDGHTFINKAIENGEVIYDPELVTTKGGRKH